jgi:hypothetical protein
MKISGTRRVVVIPRCLATADGGHLSGAAVARRTLCRPTLAEWLEASQRAERDLLGSSE